MALSDFLFDACEDIKRYLADDYPIKYGPDIAAKLAPALEVMEQVRRELDTVPLDHLTDDQLAGLLDQNKHRPEAHAVVMKEVQRRAQR